MRGKNKSKQKKGRREAKLMGRNREAEGRREAGWSGRERSLSIGSAPLDRLT